MGFTFYHLGVLKYLPSKIYFDADNITLREFIQRLSAQYRRDVKEELFEHGDRMKQGFLFVLNGKSIYGGEGLDTVITPDSQLLLTIDIYGG